MWGKTGKNVNIDIFICSAFEAGMAYNVLMNSAFFNIMNVISI